MSHSITFNTYLKPFGNNTGIVVPLDQLQRLSTSKRPTVSVNANGYLFESVVASMNGEYLISFSKAHREASGFIANQPLTVTLTLLDTPRTIELPKDLEAIFREHPVLHVFLQQSYSYQKEVILSVESAKKEETKQTRILKWIDELNKKPLV